MQIPAVSSYAADRAARLARLVGGAIYTGTAKHFVKYRDDRSPYGYDAVDIGAMPAQTDFMVHGDEFAQGYVREGDLPFARLLFRLSIRKIPGGEHLGPEDRADLFLAVAHGLADGIIRYLWRNRVEAQAGLFNAAHDERVRRSRARSRLHVDPRAQLCPSGSSRCSSARPASTCFAPPARTRRSPSATRIRSISRRVSRCFRADTFHVFWPGDRVDVLPGPLALSDIADLTRVDLELEQARAIRARTPARRAEPIGVELRLAAAMGPPRRVVATLIPLAHASRLEAHLVRAAAGVAARPSRRGRPNAASSSIGTRTST